jgi:multidrug efflux pump subunit AcrA (membrane-fusion protein)
VEIEIPNSDQLLKPGMFVRARIEFARHDNATLIPLTALVKRDDKQGVFIADFGIGQRESNHERRATSDEPRARFVPVTAGIINGELAEITEPEISGLVITLGNHLLEDGSAITLPEENKISKIKMQN